MPSTLKPGEILVHLPGEALPAGAAADTLPPALTAGSRAAAGVPDPFLDRIVSVEAAFSLVAPGRAGGPESATAVADDRLLALEAADGTTVFIRADKLRDDLARVRPAAVRADGSLDLAALRDPEAAARGVTEWIWSGLSVLSLGSDAITGAALDKAREWLRDWLGEAAPDLAPSGASWLGAKALMWAIESRLPGEPGIYHWRNDAAPAASDRCEPGDARLAAGADAPMLLFIHGTGSHTFGSFSDLRSGSAAGDWEALARRFGGRMFGFEHRTFSESPIDNALALARALPAGARLSLVTHSRGGLVGDLLCLAGLTDAAIAAYRRDPPPNTAETPQQKRLRELVAAREQDSLRALRQELADKNFRIERYVRVACPARGTSLLTDNLDVFLSGLLSLMTKLAGAAIGPAGSAALSAFRRIVLEIAAKRIDPRFLPGIEAMLTDAPMARLLADAQRKQGIAMSIISGDIEGGSVLRRLGVLFTDWMFFDRVDNDLVIDTESMYAGLAARNDARYLFDQGASVNHFSYFSNRHTRSALRDWLTADEPAALAAFAPLVRRHEPDAATVRTRAARRAAPPRDSRPVVILLPGIMGSHLEVRAADRLPGEGDRVWFDFLDLATGGLAKIRFDRPDVREEALFDMFYGELAGSLSDSHFVIRCPYDWRQPLQAAGASADHLAAVLKQALADHPNQPVRLLAHSFGGLVARTMIAKHPDLWAQLVRRPGGRLVMLGTPNNGSHLMVEALLGKSDTMRKLARLDLRNGMQHVLDIVAGFPGALQLLPRPGFADSGPTWQKGAGDADRTGYLDAGLWPALAEHNRDRWFGDHLAGRPDANAIGKALELWASVLATNDAPQPVERVHYVFGKADNTPCGLVLDGGRLKMVGTPEGDGSVSWASGRLTGLPDGQCWFMPADHGSLTDTEEHFPAIVELLQAGTTSRLGRLPVLRGAAAATLTYDAPPPVLPTEEELARSILGARPERRRPAMGLQSLHVSVAAMDLRFARQPVICGHYIGDTIAGAEASIDRYLVGGALRQRERLGVYAGEVGSSAVVLQARDAGDRPWEMLQADDQPLALKTAMVRTFASTRYRRNPMILTRKVACVIANPSTRGYHAAFGDPVAAAPARHADHLPDLPGAAAEGAAIRDLLAECGYEVTYGEGLEALDVFARLFHQPWRILALAAHGVFRIVARDGRPRSGVVLSDGLLLTAAEVGQMEIVPELVFLNCCHLGAMTVRSETANRLAYSLARELIEIGVRCVVVAGWQVNDEAAKVFATTFFDGFVRRCQPFGPAVFAARRSTWERFPQYNTWGAYQAYGDPEHVLEPSAGETEGWSAAAMVSPAELVNTLDCARVALSHEPRDLATLEPELSALLARGPAAWQALPEVQAAIGAVYGELGAAGFEPARAAYCRAIELEDRSGRVPIRTVEQLAKLELRTGEARGEVALIDRAIARLRGLIALCSADPTRTRDTGAEGAAARHAEVGRALMRKAAVLATAGASKADVEAALRESRDALALGADSVGAGHITGESDAPAAFSQGSPGSSETRPAKARRSKKKT